ncbi:MAG: neuraminidase-like domain-containing protein, partial [Cyanobacteria bacterium J06576_12]
MAPIHKHIYKILMQLRNLLISDSNAPGDTLREKAEWLDKRLLIDMFMDGCHMTTRVSQAIETLQRLVRGVYTQEHVGTLLGDFVLDAVEDYEAEWPVMGTYATWRAYMLAYLFPENLLHLSPSTRQSHGLNKLYKALPSRINEQQACKLATEYGSYFQDICHLEVQATCQLESLYIKSDQCDSNSNLYESFTHVFARSTVSGLVYWAYFPSNDYPSDSISTWTPLGRLGEVDFILGATPHHTPSGQKFLLLFTGTATDILMRKFDVSEGRWIGITKLDWPPGYQAGIVNSTVIQKRQVNDDLGSIYSFPTLVSVTVRGSSTFIQYLSDVANSWRDSEWTPLYGPSLFDEIRGIYSISQIDRSRYMLLSITTPLQYQVQDVETSLTDHYEWRKILAELP